MLKAATKRAFDLAVGTVAIVLLSPVLMICALLIVVDSPGGAFYAQDRIGLLGRHFRMLKFRSMVKDAESIGTGLFSYEDDFRITRVGRYLRLTSLDELPQLFNVIKGDMSIVGPRPPVTYELGAYEDFSPRLKSRFVVKPGITGLAQVSGRNDLDWDNKIELDFEYIERYRKWGVLYDIVLCLRTLWVVLSMKNVIEKPQS